MAGPREGLTARPQLVRETTFTKEENKVGLPGTPLPNKSKISRADQITSKKEKLFFKGLRHNCVRSYCHYEGSET